MTKKGSVSSKASTQSNSKSEVIDDKIMSLAGESCTDHISTRGLIKLFSPIGLDCDNDVIEKAKIRLKC